MGQLLGWLALSCLLYSVGAKDLVQCDAHRTAEFCEECPGEGPVGCGGETSDCFYYEPWDLCLNNMEKEYLNSGEDYGYEYDYESDAEPEAEEPASSEVAEVKEEEDVIDGGNVHEIVKRRTHDRRRGPPKGWRPLKMPKKKQKSVRVNYNRRKPKISRGPKRWWPKGKKRISKKKKAYKPKVYKPKVKRPKFNMKAYYRALAARGGRNRDH